MKNTKPTINFLMCLAMVGILILSSSCSSVVTSGAITGGTETGNSRTMSLRVIGYQSSTFPALKSLTIGNLDVSTAKLVLDEIRFRTLSSCQSGGEGPEDILITGPFVIDLLNPQAISGLEGIQIPATTYCRIELVLKKLEPDGLPNGISPSDPMVGRSIFVEGKRADQTPFELSTEMDESFKLENNNGFSIQNSISELIYFVAFDLDRWFDDIDLSDPSVEVSTDGNGDPIIFLNDQHNQEIQESVEDNIKLSADLFEDENHDNHLDNGEEDNPLATGDF